MRRGGTAGSFPNAVICAKAGDRHALGPCSYILVLHVTHVTSAIRRKPRVRSARGKERGNPPLALTSYRPYFSCICHLSKSVDGLDCNPDADSRGALVVRLIARSGPEGTEQSINCILLAYIQHPFAYSPTPYPTRDYSVIGETTGCAVVSPLPLSMSSEGCRCKCRRNNEQQEKTQVYGPSGFCFYIFFFRPSTVNQHFSNAT
jgi:hypothetical protein